ncbi:vitelline membrane outer layer protein 1-like isoform X2 [Homarus americanus]|uniref:vitelline membrane outer layer protein 1-like isoform X2 n=1 Tax=Homarus americanus TaxID=6706 RepID=UPI001C463223|nr:vitelline membrane outer layer protein 1-like isoform X2 [Homarus americanus]
MAAFWWSAVCVCLLVTVDLCVATGMGAGGEENPVGDNYLTLTLDWAMSWGVWGPKAYCPTGTYAYGFNIKVESEGAVDDTSINGIMLYCRAPGDVGHDGISPKVDAGEYTITSTVQRWGDWRGKRECFQGFLTGLKMKSEEYQGIIEDDTAANDLEMQCNWSTETLNGGGNHWGYWSDYADCPDGWVICGIETRVEAETATDDTALNDVRMFCCDTTS